jgi:hypothetical protein
VLAWATLGEVVGSVARVGSPSTGADAVLNERVNAIAIASTEKFRRDSDLVLERAHDPELEP